VDREKVLKQGVELSSVYKTLQTFMGGVFINYFNRFGRVWQVYVQAEGDYRNNTRAMGQFYVQNDKGGMVPLERRGRHQADLRSRVHDRFNEHRAAQINASLKPGYSSGRA
jgi:HAE1 family hydrophobic/amphiphilic exporter-1